MKKFEFNGKKYNSVPMNFETICDLEDYGVTLNDYQTKPMKFLRAYLAIATEKDAAQIGDELIKHLKSGGDLNKIYEIIADEINASDFFQAFNQNTETKIPEMEE